MLAGSWVPRAARAKFSSPAASVNGNISRGNFRVKGEGKRLAFGLADGQKPSSLALLEFPIIEASGLGIAVAPGFHFAAAAIPPILAIKLEHIFRVLAFIHLGQIFFGEA